MISIAARIFTSKLFFSNRVVLLFLVLLGSLWVTPEQLSAQAQGRVTTSIVPETPTKPKEQTPGEKALQGDYSLFQRPSLITQAVVLSILALLPFALMILSPFLKIAIVLSLLRNALGVQQSPPNQVINGVSFMISLFILYPTGIQMYDAAYTKINQLQAPESLVSPDASTYILDIASSVKEPAKEFLRKNSTGKHQALFYRIAYRMVSEENKASLSPTDFMILVPSYITSQLKDAFEIGVLIYIPFFVIDLVTSNILLAMGMMMLSPVTISMPLKLFLLVMLDGWTLLIEGLINTFH